MALQFHIIAHWRRASERVLRPIPAVRMRTLYLVAVLMVMGSAIFASESTNHLALSIAIPCGRHGERAIDFSDDPHFHVILRNTSNKPRRVWKEWCSWGYYALAFEITDSKGKTFTVNKKPRGWDKNYPDYWTLAPQECLVLDVAFADTAIWEGFPRPSAHRGVFKMRATFGIEPDSDSRERSVWTGRAVSESAEYVFYK